MNWRETATQTINLTSERTTLSHSLWRRGNIRTPAFFKSYEGWLIDMKIVPKIDVVYYPLFSLASARDNTKLFALFQFNIPSPNSSANVSGFYFAGRKGL